MAGWEIGETPAASYEEAYARWWAFTVQVARKALNRHPREDAEDAAGDAWVSIWQHWSQLDGKVVGEQWGFIHRTVRRRAIDAVGRLRLPHCDAPLSSYGVESQEFVQSTLATP